MSTSSKPVGGRSGGLAAWSVVHPIGVVMIALAVIVLGGFSVYRLGVDLLPHIIYPEIRVRILDPGVPARIMEDEVTRQLEEQLAITEDAIGVQSSSSEGRASVDLSFGYGKDIDIALRDASSRLDRAKRFLPDSIQPPIIYKRDPSQIPVAELVVSSALKDPVELRSWVDDQFSKWFLNLPGVAAAEVGGGLVREIQVLPDQYRLKGLGLELADLRQALQEGNRDQAGGRLTMASGELTGRVSGRFSDVQAIRDLPLEVEDARGERQLVPLGEVARVVDGASEERLLIRLDDLPGIKMSVQKQPQANTVAVVDAVRQRLSWLRQQDILPADVQVRFVGDQSIYVRAALNNAWLAAGSGALLAMAVVYLFLGSIRRTLIIGSAIPIAVMVTLTLMDMGGLTLNIMTLGGLALGIGMLVDNTIVMLENIYRHQRSGESRREASQNATAEVSSAVLAATSTNLAAVLPFLFVSGLVGLLFRELIFTISAAIVASLVVALTLVPALAAAVPSRDRGGLRRGMDRLTAWIQDHYAALVSVLLRAPWLVVLTFVLVLATTLMELRQARELFLPNMDEGLIRVRVKADTGINLASMDATVRRLEAFLQAQPEVESVYAQIGGFIFGRSQFESSNRSSLRVQLVPVTERGESGDAWAARMQKAVRKLGLPGVSVRIYNRGVRGIRLSQGDEDLSIRIAGPDLERLAGLGDQVVERLGGLPGLRNLENSLESEQQELSIQLDRSRAAQLGYSVEDLSDAVRIALDGEVVSDFIEGDRKYDIRLQLPQPEMSRPQDLESVLLFPGVDGDPAVYLADVARIELVPTPSTIRRDRQQRMVEISASLRGGYSLDRILEQVQEELADLALPAGYTLYDGGTREVLERGRRLGYILVGLALFLVLVVMAVQYESLRNPLVIMLSVPFALIGVALGMNLMELPLSMPVRLGVIMLVGMVVNNAIVLVEYVEIERDRGRAVAEAIIEAARLRIRPILMTTLTTVVGMMPLALGLGQGAEMLRPLALTIVWGLSVSMLVSLMLVPCVYALFNGVLRSQAPAKADLEHRGQA